MGFQVPLVGFHGSHQVKVDASGRILLPGVYRDGLRAACDTSLVLTLSPSHPCVLGIPDREWTRYATALDDHLRHPGLSLWLRRLFGNRTDQPINFDRRLMVAIPRMLRAVTGIETGVHAVVVGTGGGHLEVWNEASWMDLMAGRIDPIVRLPDELAELWL